MEEEEYKKELASLKASYEKSERELKIRYALANNSVKKGDVFTDHIGSIEVLEIKVADSFITKLPSCTYVGYILKTDGKRNKKNDTREAWQYNRKKD